MPFEVELETFEAKLPELRAKHEGEFVLIHGTEILGISPTYKGAIQAGNERIGFHTPFLVKWIGLVEQVTLVSPHVVTGETPNDTREEQLEAIRARIRREQYVLKVLGLFPPSSHQT